MLHPIHRVLAAFLFILFAFRSMGQLTTCGLRWDRRKTYGIEVKKLTLESRIWRSSSDASHTITEYNDTVQVTRGGRTLTTFCVKGGKVSSQQVVMKDDNGTVLWIDSFYVDEWQYLQPYTDSYRGALASRWKYYPNGMPSGVAYRNKYGADTLVIEWSETGVMRLKRQRRSEFRYSEAGILRTETRMGYKAVYAENGVLEHVSRDTTVKNQTVQYLLDYSVTGVLRKESWLKDGKPCGTWREYDAKGVLVKTIPHKPLVQMQPVDEVIELVDMYDAFAFVDELAEYPGGETALRKQLESDLKAVFCSSDAPLEGNYAIRFEVREDGTIGFLDASGWNVESIRSSLKNTIEKSPRWKPGKHNGKPVTETMLLTLRFNEV